VSRAGRVLCLMWVDRVQREGQAVRCVVNPDKLRHLGQVSDLARENPK
jgi:ABC-type transporter Mla MlaB component